MKFVKALMLSALLLCGCEPDPQAIKVEAKGTKLSALLVRPDGTLGTNTNFFQANSNAVVEVVGTSIDLSDYATAESVTNAIAQAHAALSLGPDSLGALIDQQFTLATNDVRNAVTGLYLAIEAQAADSGLRLAVGGAPQWSMTASDYPGTSDTTPDYVLYNENGDGAAILVDGANNNVGIGTTTPTAKLAVAGDFLLTETVQEDLRFPSSGINLPGAGTDPTRSNITGLLAFAAGQDRTIAGNFQLPHAWKAGTVIKPHLHLQFITANTDVSQWEFEYNRATPEGDFENAYGTYTSLGVVEIANPNNTLKHALFALGDLDMTGYSESTVVLWRIHRRDTGNTDASTIVLLDFDVHYEVEKLGVNIQP